MQAYNIGFVKQFFVRAGITSATSTSYAGAGVNWNNFRLDVTGSYHPQLGLSPGLLFIFNFDTPANVTTNEYFYKKHSLFFSI